MKIIILVLSVLLAVVAGNLSKAGPIHELPLYKNLQSAGFGARIVGGEDAEPHQFPYQVAIIIEYPFGQGLCGGSIISVKYILTAAHCIHTTHAVTVIVGAHNYSSTTEPTQQRFIVMQEDFIIHPNWSLPLIRNDIGLIKLPTPIKLSAVVKLVRLPSHNQASQSFQGRNSTVSGWGIFSDTFGLVSQILQYVHVPVISNTNCRTKYPLIQDTNICTSGENGHAACSGDSGGPLVVYDANGKPTQIGIVSFGLAKGCEKGWPSAHTRVTSYLDWIKANTH